MVRKFLLLVSMFGVVANIVVAQVGKVSGRIVDNDTHEPLIGANVVIVGTTYGAATDVEGRYVILNIPPGLYDLKASFIGYQEVTIKGISVTMGLTHTADFELKAGTIQMQPLEVVAQRPLIEKSATNVTRIIKAEDIDKLAVRGVGAYLALQAGVVQQNGNLHIRGSRPDEVGYMVEGANTKDLLGSGNLITTIPEAIEEILVQTGGYSAEYGGSNAGLVQQNLKTARNYYTGFFQIETDNFANFPYKKFLGTYSYGYTDMVVGFGGPVVADNVRLFLAGENQFVRDYSPAFWSGADFGVLKDNGFRSGKPDDPSPRPVKWEAGNIPGRFSNRDTGNGTLLLDYKPLLIRFSSSYTWSRTKSNGAPIRNIFNEARLPYTDGTSFFLNTKGTYVISPKTFLELNLGGLVSTSKTYDPNFGDDFLSYSDSVKAAQFGWRFLDRTTPPDDYTFYGFYFARPGQVQTSYAKGDRNSLGISASLTSQTGRHELKVGGSYEYWTFRNYSIGGLSGLLRTLQLRPDLQNDPEEFKRFIRQSGGVENYGYDELGIKLDGGLDGPKHPYFASFYIQDKIEFDDVIVNAGLRVDHIFMDSWRMKDPTNPYYDPINLQIGELLPGSKFTFLQPRLGFSFPASDRTVFHMQYGTFVQAPQLSSVYKGRRSAYQYFLFAFTNPLGYDLSPIRTTQYEIGFTQQFTEYAAFDITGFYRDVKGLIQVDKQPTVAGSPVGPYHVYVNSDFATTAGAELSLRLRRIKRVQAQVNYTLSDAKGTNSFPSSAAAASNIGDAVPTLVTPLTYEQRHRGTVSIDYRFVKGDGGPILEQLGINFLFTFNSGHRFTKATGGLGQQGSDGGGILNDGDARNRQPVEPINSSTTPWVYNIDLRIDKTIPLVGFNLNVYLYITNLLNTKNVINVYYRTGNAFDDGYLSNPDLSELIVQAQGSKYVDMYKAINLEDRQHQWRYNGPDLFGPPRQIRFGMRFEY